MCRFITAAIFTVCSTLAVSASAVQATEFLLSDDDGDNHGCLNCNSFDSDSICNEFGNYGSEFSSDSIWNEFSSVGSEFNSESPWNSFGKGLKVVDEDGGYYGQFTANKFAHNRIQSKALDQWIAIQEKLDDLERTRKLVCSD